MTVEERQERIKAADEYLAARTGHFAYRCHRYDCALRRMTESTTRGPRSMVRLEKSDEGIWLVFGDGKYPHDPPRPASAAEVELWERLEGERAEQVLRQQEIGALLEPLRKLVEGRYNSDCRDRSDDFWQNEGQWTVWLTRAEHDDYRVLLEALTEDDGDG